MLINSVLLSDLGPVVESVAAEKPVELIAEISRSVSVSNRVGASAKVDLQLDESHELFSQYTKTGEKVLIDDGKNLVEYNSLCAKCYSKNVGLFE